jgi:FAD dependent oxidoreductase
MTQLSPQVLVCGGGMAGVAAAVAAARTGADTLLIERWGYLGGSATAAAVGQFVGWETEAGRQVVQGIAEEIVSRLVQRGGAGGHDHFVMSTGHRMDHVEYDPEILKVVLDDLVLEAGCKPLFHASILSVERQGTTITAVTVLTKGGTIEIRPRVVIDSSGDLDVLARAGASFLPLASGEELQPGSMMFRFGPVDFDVFDAIPVAERAAIAKRGFDAGALARAALHCSRIPGTNDGWFNISRVAVDATDPFALSGGEIEGRRQAVSAAHYLFEAVPGCSAGRLVTIAAQLGIRESRRISGRYVLTADDILAGKTFADQIAIGAYPLDIHPAKGGGLRFASLGADHSYGIPYRCLVPNGCDNALVAGRGISATHEAHASVRVMPIGMAIGQAAGTAAAIMAMTNVGGIEVDAKRLRDDLKSGGAYI